MGKTNQSNDGKVSFLNSITFKIMLLVLVCVGITVSVCTLILVTNSKTEISEVTQDYMLSIAQSQRDILDMKLNTTAASTEFYDSVLKEVGVAGISSSYAYLVSTDGTMLYHPTTDKIGSPVENEVVKGLVAQLGAGQTPPDAVVSYLYKGAMKYASYAITAKKNILVISADEVDVMAPMNKIRNIGIIIAVVMLIISLAGAYVMSRLIVAPINKLTEIVGDTAKFNFRHNANSDILCKRKDENGVMARAISQMRSSLRSMVTNIEAASLKINGNVDQLQDVTNVVNSMCTDNSATTEELAAGMQETAATTESIYANIGYMQTGAKDITQLSENGDALSNEVMERASALRAKTMEATKRTQDTYESVKVRSANAIEDSKAVQKINELTEAIMAISSQTSLLALNASIEAARAGDAGRGFAVVATEISSLSDQSNASANQIKMIVQEIVEQSQNSVRLSAEVAEVITEEQGFIVETQGKFDLLNGEIAESLDEIASITEKTRTLDTVKNRIIDSVQDLSAISEENAASNQEVSASVSSIAASISEISSNAGAINDMAAELEKSVSYFS